MYKHWGNSLAVQGLRFHAFTADGVGVILGRGTKSSHAPVEWPKIKTNKD